MEIGDWRPQIRSVTVKIAQCCYPKEGFLTNNKHIGSQAFTVYHFIMVNFVQGSVCPITEHHCLFFFKSVHIIKYTMSNFSFAWL